MSNIFHNLFSNPEKKDISITSYIFSYARKSRRSETYKRSYRNIAKHVAGYEKEMGITLMASNINYNSMEDFSYYLSSLKLLKNTIVSIIGKLKHICNRLSNEGYIHDASYHDYSVLKEESTSIYLSMKEIKDIYSFRLNGENDIIRDLFIIGCLTGMRYSDYSKLTQDNIKGNIITRKTQKTGEIIEVPIHHIVKEIIDKHNGCFPAYQKSAQNFNKVIKTICKKVGICDSILVEKTRGGRIERKSMKKYNMICSHTARRSFATNAYLSGIPTYNIMLITGHKTEASFFKYIRISKKENAKELLNHDFFK